MRAQTSGSTIEGDRRAGTTSALSTLRACAAFLVGAPMHDQHLLMERDGPVVVLTLNRPQQLNALNQTLIGELAAAFEQFDHDDSARAVILTGAGERAFAAGADISEIGTITSATHGRQLAHRSHELARRMAELRAPIIAAINGFALGGGLELALACDIRLAAEHAQLGLPEVTLGIMPGWGGTQRLARLVGPGMGKLLMMTGDRIAADEALRLGLVELVLPGGELLGAARALAARIAAQPPLAVAAIKQAVNRGLELPLDDANRYEAGLFAELAITEDAREGTQAFMQKRKAEWKGK